MIPDKRNAELADELVEELRELAAQWSSYGQAGRAKWLIRSADMIETLRNSTDRKAVDLGALSDLADDLDARQNHWGANRVREAIRALTTTPEPPAVDREAMLREALEPLLRFHETGGHEGDGSDERLAVIRAALNPKQAWAAKGADAKHEYWIRMAIHALKSTIPQEGWQPIETAPKNEMILLYAGGAVRLAFWENEQWTLAPPEGFYDPTHWHPQPASIPVSQETTDDPA